MPIQPASIVLSGGESCAFTCDSGSVTWAVPSNKGKITDSGVYTAPGKSKIWFSRAVAIEAKVNQRSCGSAVVLLSPGPTWIITLWVTFTALLIGLCFAVWAVWPPPAELPWLEVSPPVATVALGGTQSFQTKIWYARDQDVTWSATGGLITPNGFFTATNPLNIGDRVILTAARSVDHTLTGTALVIVKRNGLAIAPPTVSLLAGIPQQFTAIESASVGGNQPPAGASSATTNNANAATSSTRLAWSISDPALKIKDGFVTAPKHISQLERVIVTATDTADPERQASALLYLNPGNMLANPALPVAELSRDRPLIILVMLMGALGALLAASRSLANFVGNKSFAPRWSLYYLLRPLFGAGLATIVFFGYRIGAVTGLKDTSPADPFAAAFVAGIVGLFADTVLQKLKDTIDALLPAKDDRHDKIAAAATVPSISSAQGFHSTKQMTVKGQGFVRGATVTVNSQNRSVTFVDTTQLRVTLTDSDTPGKVKVIVTNPDHQASAAFDAEILASEGSAAQPAQNPA